MRRPTKDSHEQRRLKNARKRGGGAHKVEKTVIDWDRAIAHMRALLDRIEAK